MKAEIDARTAANGGRVSTLDKITLKRIEPLYDALDDEELIAQAAIATQPDNTDLLTLLDLKVHVMGEGCRYDLVDRRAYPPDEHAAFCALPYDKVRSH